MHGDARGKSSKEEESRHTKEGELGGATGAASTTNGARAGGASGAVRQASPALGVRLPREPTVRHWLVEVASHRPPARSLARSPSHTTRTTALRLLPQTATSLRSRGRSPLNILGCTTRSSVTCAPGSSRGPESGTTTVRDCIGCDPSKWIVQNACGGDGVPCCRRRHVRFTKEWAGCLVVVVKVVVARLAGAGR
jgi:hypothetical protein